MLFVKDKIKQKEALLEEIKKLGKRIAQLEKRGFTPLQAETLMLEKEKQFQQVLEHFPVMISAFDGEGNILAWNKECERVTGYSADEITGNAKSMEMLYPDTTYRKQIMGRFSESQAGNRDWECVLTCKDGSQKIVSWWNIPVMTSKTRQVSWYAGIDITRWKHKEG